MSDHPPGISVTDIDALTEDTPEERDAKAKVLERQVTRFRLEMRFYIICFVAYFIFIDLENERAMKRERARNRLARPSVVERARRLAGRTRASNRSGAANPA